MKLTRFTKLTDMFNSIKVCLYKLWSFLTGHGTEVPYFHEPFNFNRKAFIVSGLLFERAYTPYVFNPSWKVNFHGCSIVLTELRMHKRNEYKVYGRYEQQHAFAALCRSEHPTENELAKAVDEVIAKLSALPEMEEQEDAELEDNDVEIACDKEGIEIPRNAEV